MQNNKTKFNEHLDTSYSKNIEFDFIIGRGNLYHMTMIAPGTKVATLHSMTCLSQTLMTTLLTTKNFLWIKIVATINNTTPVTTTANSKTLYQSNWQD
mmetsp:Transcript_3321/g.4849  ORF Transcript_3321/g.4849 Transcript_3321/m.4849 type:complete len:98 (-) Transcript_3321:616-909(-)